MGKLKFLPRRSLVRDGIYFISFSLSHARLSKHSRLLISCHRERSVAIYLQRECFCHYVPLRVTKQKLKSLAKQYFQK